MCHWTWRKKVCFHSALKPSPSRFINLRLKQQPRWEATGQTETSLLWASMSISVLNTQTQEWTKVAVKQAVVNSVSVHVLLSRSFTLTHTHTHSLGSWLVGECSHGREVLNKVQLLPISPYCPPVNQVKACCPQPIRLLGRGDRESSGRDRSDKSTGSGREREYLR